MTLLWAAIALVLTIALGVVWRRAYCLRRESYIRMFELPRGLFDKLEATSAARRSTVRRTALADRIAAARARAEAMEEAATAGVAAVEAAAAAADAAPNAYENSIRSCFRTGSSQYFCHHGFCAAVYGGKGKFAAIG